MKILLCILFSGALLFMAYKKQRVRGFFLVFPIMGGIIGILMPLDYIYFVAFVFFFGKAWRIRFEQELQFRKLRQWEKIMLNGTGWLALILCLAVMNLQEINSSTVTTMPLFILIINMTVFAKTISILKRESSKFVKH